MTKANHDFAHLIRSIETLIRIGNKEGAAVMIEAAEGQVAPSEIGICAKCIARRDRQLEAVQKARMQLRDGAAMDGKAEHAAVAR